MRCEWDLNGLMIILMGDWWDVPSRSSPRLHNYGSIHYFEGVNQLEIGYAQKLC